MAVKLLHVPDRPRIELPVTQGQRLLGMISLLGLAACWAAPLSAWTRLPDSVPVHFGANGEADGYGTKWLILLLPGLGIVLHVVLGLVQRIGGHHYNFPWPITEENAARQYGLARGLMACMRAFILWTFAVGTWLQVQTALGERSGLGALYLPIVLGGVVAILIGYFVLAGRAR